MNKKTLKTIVILSTSLALAAAVAVPVTSYVAKANSKNNASTSASVAAESYTKELVAVPEGPDVYYNILPTITSPNVAYADVKDKEVIMWYSSNNKINGYNKMEMNVVDYESDGVTPKTVNFSSEVATVQSAQIRYSMEIVDLDKIEQLGDIEYDSFEEKLKHCLSSGVYNAKFADTEPENPGKNTVTLSSQVIDYQELKDVIFTEVTYSINGGKEKTVFAQKNIKMKQGSAIIESATYDVDVYANVGDTIEYTVKIPSVNGDYIEVTTATVIE